MAKERNFVVSCFLVVGGERMGIEKRTRISLTFLRWVMEIIKTIS